MTRLGVIGTAVFLSFTLAGTAAPVYAQRGHQDEKKAKAEKQAKPADRRQQQAQKKQEQRQQKQNQQQQARQQKRAQRQQVQQQKQAQRQQAQQARQQKQNQQQAQARQAQQKQAQQQQAQQQQAQRQQAQRQQAQRQQAQQQQIRNAQHQRQVQVQRQQTSRRLSQDRQQALLGQQQQRLVQYRQHLDRQQQRSAVQSVALLQEQQRRSQYALQTAYVERMRQQRTRFDRDRNRDYASDPYFYTPATVRYRRGGSYYETNQYGVSLLQQAVNYGYDEGFRTGRADRLDRWRSSYADSYAYNDANYGYEGYYVDQDEYNYYFREGFRRGYDDGFAGRYHYGRYANGKYTILGAILGQILDFQSLR